MTRYKITIDVMGNLTNVVYSGGPATSQIKLGYDLLNRMRHARHHYSMKP